MTMKAFVFTLDAIFSVVFASIAVSILIYIHYTSYSPAQFQVSQASAALSNLMESGATSMFNGSAYSRYLLAYSGTSQYTWPQYGNNQALSSSTAYGPTKPLLLNSVRFSSNMIPDIALSGAHGVAELSSNQIYIFNSTTLNGILYNTANALISTPAIYGQSAIFATSNGYITAVSLSNVPTHLWSDNIGFNTISTPLDIENNYLIFAGAAPGSANSVVYLIEPSNGTVHGVYRMGPQTINTIAYDGTFLIGSTAYNSITAGNMISDIAAYGVGTYSSATPINAIGTVNDNFLIYPRSGPNEPSNAKSDYISVSVKNGGTSSTPSNFQQMVYFNPSLSSYSGYLASDLGNIRFYAGQNELYSWCESGCTSSSTNAVFWVNLGSTVIPAGNTIAINATLLSTSTEYDGVYAGEAPQLSPTYAEYDNGASVFNFYDNFKGTSLNTNKWPIYASDGTSGSQSEITVNNGLTLTAINGYGYTQINSNLPSAVFTQPIIWEADLAQSTASATTAEWGGSSQTDGQAYNNGNGVWSQLFQPSSSASAYLAPTISGTTTMTSGSGLNTLNYNLWGIYATSSSSALYYEYNTVTSQSM